MCVTLGIEVISIPVLIMPLLLSLITYYAHLSPKSVFFSSYESPPPTHTHTPELPPSRRSFGFRVEGTGGLLPSWNSDISLADMSLATRWSARTQRLQGIESSGIHQ